MGNVGDSIAVFHHVLLTLETPLCTVCTAAAAVHPVSAACQLAKVIGATSSHGFQAELICSVVKAMDWHWHMGDSGS